MIVLSRRFDRLYNTSGVVEHRCNTMQCITTSLRSLRGAYRMVVVRCLSNAAVTDSRIGLGGGMYIWDPIA